MKISLGLLFLVFASASLVYAKVHHYKLDVKYNCYQNATTINCKIPGPTIVANQGDTVVVKVKNSLFTENLTIHWNGIREADGTKGIIECPLLPGDTRVYKFIVDRSGSFIYHVHYGMQALHGMIQVYGDSEPFVYYRDYNIILTDSFHMSTYGEPQWLLINGRGNFNCNIASTDACDAINTECSPYSIPVVHGKVYLLRIGSSTAASALSFEIEGHNMRVVEADGHYAKPFFVKNLFIYPGQTYSVLVKADQDPSRNYWISSKIVSRPSNTANGLGIFKYHPNPTMRNPPTPPPVGPHWNDTAPRLEQSRAIKAHPDFINTPPKTSDHVIVMHSTQNTVKEARRWLGNNVSFDFPPTAYLIAHLFDQTATPKDYDHKHYDIFVAQNNSNAKASNPYWLKYNSTVDIILQNTNSETHTWHLHGCDFWVLGQGSGEFNRSSDPKNYNLENPIMKNTVPVHPNGWIALRFQADSLGDFAYHSHIDWHISTGKGEAFEEEIEKVEKFPLMGCNA